MNKQIAFHCPVVMVAVTLERQTFVFAGIGGAGVTTQHDYGCSREGRCEHRLTAACPVRRLNS